MNQKRGELTVEAIIKIAIVVLMLFIILFIIMMNTGAMDQLWSRIMGNL